MILAPTFELDGRIQGSLLPDTVLPISVDGVEVDATQYTWSAEASTRGSTTRTWAKTTGFSSNTDGELVIAWATGDLGALTPGEWRIEVTGLLAGKPLKFALLLTVYPEIN